MSRTVTLRIKRVYFDQILSGTKLVEYRDVKPYYERLFSCASDISRLRLHYQRGAMLEAHVDSVRRIPRPAHLASTGIDFANTETFAIILRNARLIRE